jgi:hypothetical protein
MDPYDPRIILVCVSIGAAIGAIYHFRGRLIARGGSAPSRQVRGVDQRARQHEVEPLVARAARAMVAYSGMIDAANANNHREVARICEHLVDEDADLSPAEVHFADRALRDAAHAFLSLEAEIRARIRARLDAQQALQIGGELRLRGAALARAIETAQKAANAYVARS